MDLYNYWITNSPVNMLSSKIGCTVWGGLTHLCAHVTQCRTLSPINIRLHVVLSAASLPSRLHPDRSHLSLRVASFCCPALWWAALGSLSLLGALFWVSVERWRWRWRRVSYRPWRREHLVHVCVPQITSMHLQVKWQSCLWGDVSSPLLE